MEASTLPESSSSTSVRKKWKPVILSSSDSEEDGNQFGARTKNGHNLAKRLFDSPPPPRLATDSDDSQKENDEFHVSPAERGGSNNSSKTKCDLKRPVLDLDSTTRKSFSSTLCKTVPNRSRRINCSEDDSEVEELGGFLRRSATVGSETQNTKTPYSSYTRTLVTSRTGSGHKLTSLVFSSDEDSDDVLCSSVKRPHSTASSGKLSFVKSLSPGVTESVADPEALKFRENFHSEKYKLASKLFLLFNSKIFSNKLPEDTKIQWSGLLSRSAGYCRCRVVNGHRMCIISLSPQLLTTAARLRDTLLHEMCHAAVWIINKMNGGHGPMWMQWATRCAIAFPELKVPTRCHNYEISSRYKYECTKCKHVYKRQKRTIDTNRHRCGRCRGTLVLRVA